MQQVQPSTKYWSSTQRCVCWMLSDDIWLSHSLNISVTLENEQLQIRYDQLSNNYSQLQGEVSGNKGFKYHNTKDSTSNSLLTIHVFILSYFYLLLFSPKAWQSTIVSYRAVMKHWVKITASYRMKWSSLKVRTFCSNSKHIYYSKT